MSQMMYKMQTTDEDAPACEGKYVGQKIEHGSRIWEWTGTYWKVVI
jgi:hypothetical protein